MNHSELIQRAFRIVWPRKWLWVLGFFSGGSGVTFWSRYSADREREIGPAFLAFIERYWDIVVVVAAVFALMIVFFLIVSVFMYGALIRAGADLDDGLDISFGQALGAGVSTFWRLLGLLVLVALIAGGFVFILGVPAALFLAALDGINAAIAAAVTIIAAAALLIPLLVLLSITAEFGARDVVLKKSRPMAAVRAGWGLIFSQPAQSLSVWAVSLGLGLAFSIVMIFTLIALAIPVATVALTAYARGFSATGIFLTVFTVMAAIFALIAMMSGWRAFQTTYWTLAYKYMAMADTAESAGEQFG